MIHFRMFVQASLLLLSCWLFTGCNTNERPVFIDPKTGLPVIPPDPSLQPPSIDPPLPNQIFVQNKQVKVGIGLNYGGAITFLSENGGPNMVNNNDYGRQIQNSLYSGPIPYRPHGKNPVPQWINLGWNPVQAGDVYLNPAKVVTYRVDSTHIYVKTEPLIWPVPNEPGECTMETWIELVGNTVRVHSRTAIARADTTQYDARTQEAPALYLNGPYYRRVAYTGNQPFSNGPTTELPVRTDVDLWYTTENWAALLNVNGRGVGLWHPNLFRMYHGLFGVPGTGTEYDVSAGYLAGSPFAVLDHDGVYEYEYVLVVGDLPTIRKFAYDQPRPSAAPNYQFGQDRQGWYYSGTRDQGWPVRGELVIRFEGNNWRIMSPPSFWQAAAIPKLYLQAAFTTKATTARLSWRIPGDNDFLFLPERLLDFPITGDGQYRTYEIDLNKASGWRGIITQIGLEPSARDTLLTGRSVRLKRITAVP